MADYTFNETKAAVKWTKPDTYILLISQPSDWTTNWKAYYQKIDNTYSRLTSDTAPTFASNTYYSFTLAHLESEENISKSFGKIDVLFDHVDTIESDVNDLQTTSHTHTNKSILDNTTASFTTEEKTKLSNIEEEANKITAGTGLEKSGTALNHSNSVTAKTTANFAQIKYDTEGHITESTDATTAQLAAINSGITSTDKMSYDNHLTNTSNPHSVTKTQVGLGNVDNTSDANKPISTATQAALDEQNETITELTGLLDSVYKIMNGTYYSVFIDYDNADNCKSLMGDFRRIKAFSERRRCNVADDGTINAFVEDSSYVEDGTNGQVMVYQPKFYYRVEPVKLLENTTEGGQGYHIQQCIYSISDFPVDGFKLHPAFINENGDEIDYILIGAFEGCIYDTSATSYITDDSQVLDITVDKLSSIAGVKPASGRTQNLTRVTAEQISQNRGAGWHTYNIKIASANQLMELIEFGPNIQLTLGAGVSGITDNTSYNCSSYTGSTSNGLYDMDIPYPYTGMANSTINEIGGTETTYTADTDANKVSIEYRGMENPYGNIWDFVIGMNIYGDGTMLGGIPYICNDYNFAESRNSGNYESAGFTTVASNGYIKYFGYGNTDYDWLLVGSSNGGSANGVIGDYHYITSNLNGYRISLLGGTWYSGSRCGAFYWHLYNGVGNRGRNIGARICYIPQK